MQKVKMLDPDKRKYRAPKDENPTMVWSLIFNGQPIWKMLSDDSLVNLSLAQAKNLIEQEGGTVDDNGIIHRAPVDALEYAKTLITASTAEMLNN